MSDSERAVYVAEEGERHDEPPQEDPDDVYSRLVGEKLFGLSQRDQAFLESAFDKAVESILPGRCRRGMRNFVHALRARFAAKLVVPECNATPEGRPLA